MKYLYQQLLAFWGVIILIVLIVGTSFSQLTKKTMQENNYQQLYGYAESALQTHLAYGDQNLGVTSSFEITEKILEKQKVKFIFVDADQKVKYPITSASRLDYSLIEKNWNHLIQGNKIYTTINQDVYGNKEPTSYVMLPVITNTASELVGVLVVSQPAKNVTESVNSVTVNLVKGFIISSVVAVIASYFFASFQVRRIDRIRKAAKEIASGNFDVKLEVQDKDEFDDLADDFNKMAESLVASRIEIERQEARRRQFMADASHEMRTPLTTINGLLEGLEYHALTKTQEENAIKLMRNETERLIRLVNENLDYEKIRTNQISIVIKKFDGQETLQTILDQLNQKAQLAGDQLILETKAPVEVFADYDRFVQIMVNVIQNAIQFTTDGTIRISIEKGYLETIVRVADTGIGMSPEQIQNIWDRYYKVDPSRKNTKYGESGLGLAIVQQLVLLHKGKIFVESELGEGTTFSISFPDVEIDTN